MGSAPYFFLDRVVDRLSGDLALRDLVAREDNQPEVLLPTPPPHVSYEVASRVCILMEVRMLHHA